VAELFFIVAGLVVIRLALNGVFRLFTSKPVFKPGTDSVLAAVAIAALVLGVAFTIVG
jgi:hypothetical protein